MKYKQLYDGDEIAPVMEGYRLRCCDCGLVHNMDFEAVKVTKHHPDGTWDGNTLDTDKYKVMIKATRNNRATAACRRKKKGDTDADRKSTRLNSSH